ncbi:MAG TPA: hypothetical protein VEM32_06905 [Geobacteraceae bacterium]|nr:hypothetical protein [Geobacteraceae bacterium]
METFIVKLAVAVVPLVALVAIVILAKRYSGRTETLRVRANRTRAAVRHAFAVAATQKWF